MHTSLMVTPLSRILASLALAVSLGCFPLSAHALTSLSGSGTGTHGEPISATADFAFSTHDFGAGDQDALQITLANTSDTTNYRGNLLTGFFFNMEGIGALTTDSTGFDGLAPTVRPSSTTSISNVEIGPAIAGTTTEGTYLLANGPFGTANSGADYSGYAYGIATVGMGLAGFNGGATNGDNYGIAAAGSSLTTDGLPSALPVIDTTAIFWILRPEALASLDQIVSARFAFGSLPDNKIDVVPIPGTLALFGSGLLGLIGVARLRLKR